MQWGVRCFSSYGRCWFTGLEELCFVEAAVQIPATCHQLEVTELHILNYLKCSLASSGVVCIGNPQHTQHQRCRQHVHTHKHTPASRLRLGQQCGMWNVECGMWNAEWAECRMLNAEC